MIRLEEVFKIGYIAKHRGLRGEVELSFTDDCFDTGTAETFSWSLRVLSQGTFDAR